MAKISPLDLKKNTAIGLSLPLLADNKNFFELNYQTNDQIHSNLINLLSTHKGERIMNPKFGTNLRRVLFEQVEVDLRIREEIEIAIEEWMSYVNIDNIEITTNDNQLYNVVISYYTKFNEEATELELVIS